MIRPLIFAPEEGAAMRCPTDDSTIFAGWQVKLLCLIFLVSGASLSTWSSAAWGRELEGHHGLPPTEVLTLEQCIEMALKYNPEMAIARGKIESAQALSYGSWSQVLPAVNVSLINGSRSIQGDRVFNQDVPVQTNPDGTVTMDRRETRQAGRSLANFQFNAAADFKLYDGGQAWNTIRRERQNVTNARFNLRAVRNKIAVEVIGQYYQVLKSVRLEKLYSEQVGLNEELVKQVTSLLENGLVGKADELRARAQLNRMRVEWLNQKKAVLQARSALNTTLGRYRGALLSTQRLEDRDFVPAPLQASMDEYLASARSKNFEILRDRGIAVAARISERIARGIYWPVVTGSVSYARVSSELDRVYGRFGENWGLNIGLNVSLDLLKGALPRAEYLQAQANRIIAEETLEQTINAVTLAIETAVRDFEVSREIVGMGQESIANAEEALRLVEELYRIGEGTLLDVISARVDLLKTKTDIISSQYDIVIAAAKLKHASGQLQH